MLEDGKFLKKKNTFTDYIDCADFLISNNSADNKNKSSSGALGLNMSGWRNRLVEKRRRLVSVAERQ